MDKIVLTYKGIGISIREVRKQYWAICKYTYTIGDTEDEAIQKMKDLIDEYQKIQQSF